MSTKTKTIFSVTRRDGRDHWKRIGVAIVNDDGSENLVFDQHPIDPQTTIQVRENAPDGAAEPDPESQ